MNLESLNIDDISDEQLIKILHEFKIKHSCNVIDFECQRKTLKEAQESSSYINLINKKKRDKNH